MKDRKDDILNYAFGEMSASEAQVFEATLLNDPAVRTEVESLRSLKTDLSSMREVPEVQFSSERLREALVASGKPKFAFPWFKWAPYAMVPVAGLACYALFATLNAPARGEPTFVASTNSPKPLEDVKIDFSRPEIEPEVRATVVAPKIDAPKVEPGKVADAPRRVERSVVARVAKRAEARAAKRSEARRRSETVVAARNNRSDRDLDSASVGRDSVAAPAMTKAEPSLEMPGKDDSIVLISSSDAGNGSTVATEVNDTRNVIVGG